MLGREPRLTQSLLLVTLLFAAVGHPTLGQRPTAMALFPAETTLFLRTADASQFIDRMKHMGVAQMLQDPAMQRFTDGVYDSVRASYSESAEDALGASLEQLQNLPQGELAFGVVEHSPGEAEMLFIGEFRDQAESAMQMIENAKRRVAEDGGVVSEQTLRADTAIVLRAGNDQQRMVGVVRRDDVFVAATDPELLASVLDRWDGEPVTGAAATDAQPNETRYTEPLQANRVFANSLRDCLRGREEPPQAIGFIDPIGLVRAAAGRQAGVRVALAALPALGVDAFEGGAGALWMATESWDSLFRGFFSVDNPRAGIVHALRLAEGDSTPPDFVPTSVTEYWSLTVQPQQLVDDLRAAIDRFAGEGFFDKRTEFFVQERIGFSLQEGLLPIATGRVLLLKAFEPDTGSPIEHNFVALEVNDREKGAELLQQVVLRYATRGSGNRSFSKHSMGEQEYWSEGVPGEPPADDRPRFTPTFALLGDFLVVGSSSAVMRTLCESQSQSVDQLAASLQFRLVQSRLRRLAGGNRAQLLMYTQPEASLRHWWAMASDAGQSQWLQQANNPVMKAVREGLNEGDLPPVEDVLRYFPAGGTVIYDTDTGFEAVSFTFRPAQQP